IAGPIAGLRRAPAERRRVPREDVGKARHIAIFSPNTYLARPGARLLQRLERLRLAKCEERVHRRGVRLIGRIAVFLREIVAGTEKLPRVGEGANPGGVPPAIKKMQPRGELLILKSGIG